MKTRDLFRRFPPNARLLLVRLRSMGDCVLLTGPVRALKEEFPGFRISVLAESRFAPCFDGNPDFNEVISLNNKYSAGMLPFKGHFDAVLNLHGGPTSLIYSCLALGRRIGMEQFQYSKLYHGLAPSPSPGLHTVEATMSVFHWLGVRLEKSPPLRYEIHPREAARIRQTMKDRPYVVVHPGALMSTKRWDPSLFAAVARTFKERHLRVVVTCGPGEEAFAGRVAKDLAESTVLLGLTIPELAELIRQARLFLGNDSGPMHLAAAVGTPVVAVWGSSDSQRWRPWSTEHRVVQNPFECNPCPGYRCLVAETPLCIESVTVAQVNEAVQELLK